MTSSRTPLRSFSYGPQLRPMRDWFVLLTLAGILLLASVLWNVWYLWQVEEAAIAELSPAEARFDAAPVESLRTVFEERAAALERYRSGSGFVDPSR